MPDDPIAPDPLAALRQRLRPLLTSATPATALQAIRADIDAGRFDDLLVHEQVDAWLPAALRPLDAEPGNEEILLVATTGWLLVRFLDQHGGALRPDLRAAGHIASSSLIVEACMRAGNIPLAAEAYFNLGITFQQQRQLEVADQTYAEAERIYRELVATGQTEVVSDLAMALMNRGIVLFQQGQLAAALAVLEEAERIYRELLAAGRDELAPDLARTLMNRGTVLSEQGQLPPALALYAETERIYRELLAAGRDELAPGFARTLVNRGIVHFQQGQLAAALAVLEEAERIYRELLAAGRDDLAPDLAGTLTNRGNVLQKQGRLTPALTALEEAEDRFRELVATGRTGLAPDLARTLVNRGIVLAGQGQLTPALIAYDGAERLFRDLMAAGRNELAPDLAGTLMNRGNVHFQQGQLAAALAVLEEAERIYRELVAAGQTEFVPNLARNLVNRGIILTEQGQPTDALTAYEVAEGIYRDLITAGRTDLPPDLAGILLNRGNVLVQQGQLTAALIVYGEAEQLYRELLAAGRVELAPDLARTLMNRGNALFEQGQLPAALPVYDEVERIHLELLAAGQAEVATDIHWRLLYQRARLLAAQGEVPAAWHDLAAALALLEQHAGELTSLDDRLAVRESALDVYRLAAWLRLIGGDDTAAADVFALAQRAKGRTLADLYPLQATDLTASSPERALAGLKLQQRELLRRAAILAQAPPAAGRDVRPTVVPALVPTDDLAAVTAKLTALEAEIADAQAELARTDPGRALLATGAVRTLAAELAPVLHPGEALLDVFDLGPGNGVFCALLLPTQSTIAWSTHLPDAVIVPLLERWDDAPTHENDFNRWEDVTDYLGPVLFPPDLLHRLDEAGVTQLVLCPSSRLHSLPFAALRIRVDDTLVLLSERFVLSLVPTATSLWLLRTQGATLPDSVTVLAAAPFSPVPLTEDDLKGDSTRIRDGLALLPWTGREVETVADLFNEALPHAPHAPVVLAGPAATRAAVLELMPAATHVLLASHGQPLAAGETLLEYQLLFAPPAETDSSADDADDVSAVLTVREVFARPRTLSGVVQLCLTACHLGDVVLRGEEALGFSQAFLSAGVRVVLAPLWAVHDQATALLSIAYHQALLRPERPTVGEAWQEAMAVVRNHSDFEHPRYWAAFLPAGDAALRLPPLPPA